jgi:hypothetical protein
MHCPASRGIEVRKLNGSTGQLKAGGGGAKPRRRAVYSIE